jgi:glycosyltransferase involved in cell wall biosynthesis
VLNDQDPARIGLNLLWLVPGVVGGSEEYTVGLLDALADEPPEGAEFVVFANRLVLEAYPELSERFACVTAPVSGRTKSLRVAAESTWLAAAARRHHLHVVHHLGGIMPFARSVPGLLTVHDLQPLFMPAHFRRIKRTFARASIPVSVRRARRILTLTEYTRATLVDELGADPARIEVIPAGIARPTTEQLAAEAATGVRSRYGIGERPFFLYPAITYPHKNHLFLLEAFRRVARRHPDSLLVLTGGSAQDEAAVAGAVRALGLEHHVVRPGRIPRLELDALYQEATALVFPSRFEGFGMPVLEAMSRGCPTVLADATSLPEVGGDAAVLLPLGDAPAWTDEMLTLLEDGTHRADLAERGHRRAARFDWKTVAEQLSGFYRRGLAASPSSGVAR